MNWICCVYLFLTCILLNKTRRRRGSIEPGVGMWVSYLNREKKLDKLVGQRPVAPVAPKGLYLYGNVGSGKLPESYTCMLKISNFYNIFCEKWKLPRVIYRDNILCFLNDYYLPLIRISRNYLYIGKTMLMDMFYGATEGVIKHRRRFHFHEVNFYCLEKLMTVVIQS